MQETEFPTISWGEFLQRFRWKQGEHVTMLGTTGYGKSTLERLIVPMFRSYVVVFATKKRDDTMDKFRKMGFELQRHFNPDVSNYIVLKPKIDIDDDRAQRGEFDSAMTRIFHDGSWCMVWDEAAYMSHDLGLERKMARMLMQGRSLGISCVTTTQRPAFIPVHAYDLATHLFFWKMKLDRDVERVARLGGVDIAGMNHALRVLPKYTFLYYNKDKDETVLCQPEI